MRRDPRTYFLPCRGTSCICFAAFGSAVFRHGSAQGGRDPDAKRRRLRGFGGAGDILETRFAISFIVRRITTLRTATHNRS